MAHDEQEQEQQHQHQHQQIQEDSVVCLPPDKARDLLLRGDAPVGMQVSGHLELRFCSALLSLPDGLSVSGRLDLVDCSALTNLPDGLIVGGLLCLDDCSALTSLPDDLSVGDNLILSGCSALQERHRSDMGGFFEQLSAVLGPKAGLSLLGWDAVEHVPDGFSVGGDLVLGECSDLTSLGDGVSVGGDLELQDCPLLTSMGEGVSIGGTLDLRWCSALTSLPESVSVGVHLDLEGCSALQERHRGDTGIFLIGGLLRLLKMRIYPDNMDAFFRQLSAVLGPKAGLSLARWDAVEQVPDGFSVGGNFILHDCSALTSLGERVIVGNGLDISGCSSLTSLGDGLSVGGDLDFHGCSSLQERHRGDMGAFFEQLSAVLGPKAGLSLAEWDAVEQVPDGFSVGGNLDLWRCSALTSLGDNLSIGGKLNLTHCSALTSLGDGLKNGSLTLAGCKALTSLPTSLRVKGTLDLRQCTALEAQHRADMEAFLVTLREIIGPSGGLRLVDWTTIRELPNCYADIGGELDLSGCTGLTRLPEGLHVHGDLTLGGCTALRRLPDGLRVDGGFYLKACTSLTSLPRGLWVSGTLWATQCTSLASLPEDLYVSWHLSLEQCTSLESVPASFLEWPLRENGNPHDIYLGGSGLSAETLEWLREADAPGLRFHVDLRAGQSGSRPGFASAAEAAAFWSSDAQVEAVAVPTKADDATLVRFLSRLRDAKEFGIAETRKALAKRVVDVLELLSSDDEHVREELLLRMSDSLDACDDKPVWALNQMHLVVEVAKARESAGQLRHLGRRVMRLMVVHEHAKRKVDSLRWVDDVCVYLRFEIDLREALDLPVAATAMIYPSYIKIEDTELEAAKTEALAITDAQFEAWLGQWPEWQRHERHQVVEDILRGRWSSIEAVRPRQSPPKRRRLLLNLSGDKLEDPVTLDNGKSVWSLDDLLRHWERTGLDLYNAPVSVEQLRSDLKRVVAQADQ